MGTCDGVIVHQMTSMRLKYFEYAFRRAELVRRAFLWTAVESVF